MTEVLPLLAEGSTWEGWSEIGARLVVPEGVHHPSPFSAVLAAAPTDVRDRVVVDAGSGAGLITISALSRGARAVVACDLDAAALAATKDNVIRLLGESAAERLSLYQADFRQLGLLRADIILANPPQRPEYILSAVPASERHLHAGAGADGLDAIRLILDYAEVSEVCTTAAAVLPVETFDSPRWPNKRVVSSTVTPMNPVWKLAGVGETGGVTVWSFTR